MHGLLFYYGESKGGDPKGTEISRVIQIEYAVRRKESKEMTKRGLRRIVRELMEQERQKRIEEQKMDSNLINELCTVDRRMDCLHSLLDAWLYSEYGAAERIQMLGRYVEELQPGYLETVCPETDPVQKERWIANRQEEIRAALETVWRLEYPFNLCGKSDPRHPIVDSIRYPRSLSVCAGNGRGAKGRLGTALRRLCSHGRIIAEFPPDETETKTLVLVTDKWNRNIFRRYEATFLYYAICENIWPVFLLAADYGYTEIPFLPHNREALRAKISENTLMSLIIPCDGGLFRFADECGDDERPVSYGDETEEGYDALNGEPIEIIRGYGTWGPNKLRKDGYTISGRSWKRVIQENIFTAEVKVDQGQIDRHLLEYFLRETAWLKDELREEEKCIMDMPDIALKIFGGTFHLQTRSLDPAMRNHRRYERVYTVVENLLRQIDAMAK